MTSVYNLLREACGISQSDAADHVHETRLDTVKSWSSDRRSAPDWAINQLQRLLREIRTAGERHAEMIMRNAAGNVFILGHAHDDADARSLGFPSMAAERKALAIAISMMPDDAQIQLIPRIRGDTPAPILERERPTPTKTDRQVLMEMRFVDEKCLTEGKMNRRRFERLEDIGWIKGIESNAGADVTYYLTAEGKKARQIQPGDFFRFPHPSTGRDTLFKLMAIRNDLAELQAFGQPSGQKTVRALVGDIEWCWVPEPTA